MMDGLFSFLLFAGFFYFMMRVGCGSHAIRGHHHGQNHDDSPSKHSHDTRNMTDAMDPVCGKSLRDDEGYGKMHKGQLYRFCSQKCLQTFEGHPEEFMLNSVKTLEQDGGHKK